MTALIFAPIALDFYKDATTAPLRYGRWLPGWRDGCASGIIVSETACKLFKERAAVLEKYNGDGHAVWDTTFAVLTYEMTHQRTEFWTAQLGALSFTKANFKQLVTQLRSDNPKWMLIDDPKVVSFPSHIANFEARLVRTLGVICPPLHSGGWLIYDLSPQCHNLEIH